LNGGVKPRCQKAIAKRMLKKFEELGDVKFIINVGDSFYPHGVKSKSDHQWAHKWRAIYHKKLRSVPWYSVYGNHDFQHDPCACAEYHHHCAQHNANKDNHRFFFMPNFSYTVHHPEFDMEVIGLELNKYQTGIGWNAKKFRLFENPHPKFSDCEITRCPKHCHQNAHRRAEEAFHLFHHRRQHSPAKNLLVFSHYPTEYFRGAPHFIDGLRDPSKKITYFGGHRHDVDKYSMRSIHPNVGWLVGGGGGWSCDGSRQGFVVGTVDEDREVQTHSIILPKHVCCKKKK